MKFNKFFLLILLCTHSTFAASNNQFADFFNSLESLTADFRQTTYDNNQSLIATHTGKVIFKRPKQLHWHTKAPEEQILLLNHEQLWLIDVPLKQASLQSAKGLAQTPLYWLINKPNTIDELPHFSHQQAGVNWYQAPIGSREYQQLLFGFKGKHLHGILLKNQLQQTILVVFERTVINPVIKNKMFEPVLSADFDVIR